MFSKIILSILIITSLGGVAHFQTGKPPAKLNSRPIERVSPVAEPFDKVTVAEMAARCATLDTEVGVIVIEFFPESAPESVRNFLNLAGAGLYDTTTFSRVVAGFVIQGGSLGTREGLLTKAIADRARRTVPDERNKILHERAIVSMARGDEPNTATTNFFILVDKAPHLDNKFAAFGRVTKGMEVVDAINKAPTKEEKPEKPVRVRKVSIGACPAAPSN